jgi:rod shape-determining protein MreD
MNLRRGWVVVVGSFVAALALELLPLPTWAEPARPAWLAAVLLWWCLHAPQRANVGSAFVLGILMDVLKGSVLGQHALALTLAAFLAARFHLQIRVFPMWQQTTMVGVLALLTGAVLWWTDGMAGQPSSLLLRIPGAITTALLWPWLAEMMRGFVRRSDPL